MAGDELPAIVDLDHLPVCQDFDALTGQAAENRVAVRLEGHQAVLGHIPQRPLLKDIGSPFLRRERQVLLLEEHLGRLPVRRAVDTLVGDVDDPGQKLGVEIVQTGELFSPKEPLDVFDARLHLALGLGPIGPMRSRTELVIPAEVPEDRVPLEPRALEVAAEYDRPQVVVDDLMGHAAQVREALGAQEGRKLLVLGGDGVHPPAVAQGQDEQMDFNPLAIDDRPALPPVGLALAPRRRFEPDRRLDLRFLPQRADEALDGLVASPISPGLQLLEDRLGAIAHGRQALEHVIPEGSQGFALPLLPDVSLRFFLTEDLPDRLDVQTDRPGDGLFRLLELEPAVDLLPQVRFDHVFSSRLNGREEA